MSSYPQPSSTTADMGHRVQRKRVRHRSRHGSRHSWDGTSTSSAAAYQSFNTTMPNCTQPSFDYRSQTSRNLRQPERLKSSNKRAAEEDDATRRIRVFGGSADEAQSTELCGPMLDVVLGLFGGVDYDDNM